jgi:hypothetical protein
VRVWPVLLLLSCSRPNPLFLLGGASGDMSSGTDPTTTTAAATTDIGTTAPSTTGTTAGVTTSTPTTSTTGEPFTTGEPSTTAVSSTTGDEHPACGPFSEQRLILDPPLPEPQCVEVTEYFGKVTKTDDDGTIALCADALCALCPLSVPLDPDLALYVDDGDCLRVVHQGEWAPGDPEAPTGCKTTAIALFDDASIYPLYAASSRVIDAPGFLDSAVRLDVQREAGTACACGPDDCCLEGQAEHLRLTFTDHGEPVGTLGPDQFATVDLEGVDYLVAVIRAHAKGYFDAVTQRCVADPETAFVDWHMLRVDGP